MGRWFWRIVGALRAAGAGATLWAFLKSQMAAIYLWAPLVTVWGFIAGWKEEIPTPYLLAACALIFGSINWCSLQLAEVHDRYNERHKKLKISYDRGIHGCRDDVTFGDNSHSMCFHLK